MKEEISWRRKADSLKIIYSTDTMAQFRSLEPIENTHHKHLNRVITVESDFISSVRK